MIIEQSLSLVFDGLFFFGFPLEYNTNEKTERFKTGFCRLEKNSQQMEVIKNMIRQKRFIKEKMNFLFLPLLLSILLIVAVACSKPATPEEKISMAKKIVENHLPQIKQRLLLLKEIGSKAEVHPAVTVKNIELGNRPKMSRYFSLDPLEKRTRALKNLPLYLLLNKPRGKNISLSLGSWYTNIKDYVQQNFEKKWLSEPNELTLSIVEKSIKDEIDEFLTPRYLMIVRTHELIKPALIKMVEAGQETKDDFGRKIAGQFKKGSVRGDILIYDLSEGDLLGGLPFYKESSTFVSAEKVKTDPEAFISDLVRAVQYYLEVQLKPFTAN